MKQAYLFSGLGADHHVFKNLHLPGCELHFIQWIKPLRGETIENYSMRLAEQIKSKKPVLIGLSFGGIMAVEMAKQIETEEVILISSVKLQQEIPFYFRLAGAMKFHRVPSFYNRPNFFNHWLFGAESTEEKQLLNTNLKNTDKDFLQWALHQVMTYQNKTSIINLMHIHGTHDRILPFRRVQADRKIYKGGHLMVLNRAKEISTLINERLFRAEK